MRRIFSLLEKINDLGYEGYIVGGFVRDYLLGKKSFDVDICTSAKTEDLKKIIPNLKEKDFFCSYFQLDEFNIEITTYRKESNYDGRRPGIVSYVSSLKEDLNRRDFTINAICMDKNGNIIDLMNGREDVENKIIRCIGNESQKLEEDYLRILRAIRFATTLNFKLDEKIKNYIINHKYFISQISSFHKRRELDKIITSMNINIIKELNIEKELGITFPNKLNYCDDIIGIYAQCNIEIEQFFNKQELKKYNMLHRYYLKELNNYDLFVLGIDNIKLLEQINNCNYIDKYNLLKIKNIKEIDYDIQSIPNKELVIKAILDKKIENKHSEILKYINNSYN